MVQIDAGAGLPAGMVKRHIKPKCGRAGCSGPPATFVQPSRLRKESLGRYVTNSLRSIRNLNAQNPGHDRRLGGVDPCAPELLAGGGEGHAVQGAAGEVRPLEDGPE